MSIDSNTRRTVLAGAVVMTLIVVAILMAWYVWAPGAKQQSETVGITLNEAEPATAAEAAAAETVAVQAYRIEGMHCEGCARAIRERLAGMDGVESVSVAFADGLARVTVRPDGPSDEQIARAVADMPPNTYSATRLPDDPVARATGGSDGRDPAEGVSP